MCTYCINICIYILLLYMQYNHIHNYTYIYIYISRKTSDLGGGFQMKRLWRFTSSRGRLPVPIWLRLTVFSNGLKPPDDVKRDDGASTQASLQIFAWGNRETVDECNVLSRLGLPKLRYTVSWLASCLLVLQYHIPVSHCLGVSSVFVVLLVNQT